MKTQINYHDGIGLLSRRTSETSLGSRPKNNAIGENRKGFTSEQMSLLLSCVSIKHSVLKRHWDQSRQQLTCPVTVLGSYQKPQEDQGGLLCLIDEAGHIQKTVEFKLPTGMVYSENGVLIASLDTIYEVSADLSVVHRDSVSLPLFNMLHSMSRTQRGYLVASTGLDLLVEFTRDGQILWSWWAIDHGFELTPMGNRRVLDKSADHRGCRYGTLLQTTHINSAVELPDGRILASLFHQGMIIAIDRESGAWQSVLEGLDHPHSIRVLDEHHFTVADTARGKALLVSLTGESGKVELEVAAGTDWLQDCLYDDHHDRWVLVDGKHSRIILLSGRSGDKAFVQFDLDPEWRLYEALLSMPGIVALAGLSQSGVATPIMCKER